MATAVAEPKTRPNLKDIDLPYVVEHCLLMTAGCWNGVEFPASAIEPAARKLADDKDSTVRLFIGATTDHQDSTGTMVGHSENHEWDGKTLWGDCVFIDEKAARIAKYQKETNLKLEGISPRMTTHPEWKPASARVEKIVEFKSFGIVLDPAQGGQAMLGKDSEGRTLLGDGPVVLLEEVELPFPNFHAARIREPGLFARIVQLQELPNGIRILGGPLKTDPGGSGKPQTYRFPKAKFTVEQSKKWLKDHNIKWILFEEASEAEGSNLDKNEEEEVSKGMKLFCEKCDLLFDEGTEKCSKCEGTLKDADEATVARLEEKAATEAKEAQEKKDAEAAAQKKADEAAEAKLQKEKDDAAVAEAEAQKEKAFEFPEATHKSKPYLQGPHGYKHPYYGKPEGEFHKEPTKVRTHILSRKPALDQVADLDELTQDFVGFCGAVLKSHIEGKLELEPAIVEITAMLREIPMAAELSKEEVPMDEAFLALVKENDEHRQKEVEAEVKTIIDEGHKLAPAMREDVEALLSIPADATLSEEGEAIDVAACTRRIIESLPIGAVLSLDEKKGRLVSKDSKLNKEDQDAESKRESGAKLVPKNMRKKDATE